MADAGAASSSTERLDHLGTVVAVCREIGVAAWLDAQAPGRGRREHPASLLGRLIRAV